MKQTCLFILFIAAVWLAACDSFEDPAYPEINDCSFSVMNNENVPLSGVWLKVYYTDRKPDFVVDSAYTSVLGKGKITSLAPGDYILKAFSASGEELGLKEIIIQKDNSLNVFEWTLDVFVENYDFTVTLADNRQNPVVGRKVALYTTDANPVLIREGQSDAQGKVVFAKTVVGTYNVYVYDEENSNVFKQSVANVGSQYSNTESFLIRRIFHNTNIVITGFLNDPKGSDSPAAGAVSGDGFVHPGQYEYVQLLAVKDIDFTVDPYSVVFTNSGTPSAYGWADGIYDTASKKVYQINLTTGSVKKGQYFYVGGSSRMICSYYKLAGSQQLGPDKFWGVDYLITPGGNGNGAAKGTAGLMGNGSGTSQSSVTKSSPDGIAVFKGTQVTENTVPADAIFYGTSVTYQAYQVPDNDIYSRSGTDGAQPVFGQGTNTFLFPVAAQDIGVFIKLGGEVTPTEWLIPRSGTPFVFNLKDLPAASVSDIENAADCTVFTDK
jgi:hypothetical protein